MSLQRVEISEEVLLTCMTHAFTTEGEEIMGLLLGDIVDESVGVTVSRVWMAYPQIRTDRRKDRVETSPEQMARCSAHADRLSRETGIRTRVVGWYHSHPHITVLPSHVDVRTQGMYQMLDPGFVGLIFSVFNTDGESKGGHIQVTAFQSVPSSHPEAARGGGAGLDGGQLVSYSSEALAGLDTPTKEAIRLSAEAMHDPSAGQLVRKEVKLVVTPARSTHESSSLHDLVVVQRILALEEKEAYKQATRTISLGTAGAGGDAASGNAAPGLALAQVHAAGAYLQDLAQMLDMTVASSLVGLRSLASQQALQVSQLEARNKAIKDILAQRHEQARAPVPAHAVVPPHLSKLSLSSQDASPYHVSPRLHRNHTGSPQHTGYQQQYPQQHQQQQAHQQTQQYQQALQQHYPQASSPPASIGAQSNPMMGAGDAAANLLYASAGWGGQGVQGHAPPPPPYPASGDHPGSR